MSLPNSSPSLLLLPPPPKPAENAALRQAYYPPLKAALTSLASLKLPSTTILYIALPIALPGLRIDVTNFYGIEKLLAGVYSLVSVICAKERVEIDGPGGIDVRIILLHDGPPQEKETESTRPSGGPIISYSTLAISRRKWRYVFTVDGEVGQNYAARFLGLLRRPFEGGIHIVEAGLSIVSSQTITTASSSRPAIQHDTVAVGGTFDNLHVGHKLLLTATALLLQHTTDGEADTSTRKRLIVGITGDELLKNKKYREYLASWEDRARDVTEFLKSILLFVTPGYEDEQTSTTLLGSSELASNASRAIHTLLKPSNIVIECVEIQDPFGPTVTDESVTGLVLSGETRSGGKAINDKRAENGWQPLEVFEIAVLDAEDVSDGDTKKQDFATKISSSEIRRHKAERAKISSGPSL